MALADACFFELYDAEVDTIRHAVERLDDYLVSSARDGAGGVVATEAAEHAKAERQRGCLALELEERLQSQSAMRAIHSTTRAQGTWQPPDAPLTGDSRASSAGTTRLIPPPPPPQAPPPPQLAHLTQAPQLTQMPQPSQPPKPPQPVLPQQLQPPLPSPPRGSLSQRLQLVRRKEKRRKNAQGEAAARSAAEAATLDERRRTGEAMRATVAQQAAAARVAKVTAAKVTVAKARVGKAAAAKVRWEIVRRKGTGVVAQGRADETAEGVDASVGKPDNENKQTADPGADVSASVGGTSANDNTNTNGSVDGNDEGVRNSVKKSLAGAIADAVDETLNETLDKIRLSELEEHCAPECAAPAAAAVSERDSTSMDVDEVSITEADEKSEKKENFRPKNVAEVENSPPVVSDIPVSKLAPAPLVYEPDSPLEGGQGVDVRRIRSLHAEMPAVSESMGEAQSQLRALAAALDAADDGSDHSGADDGADDPGADDGADEGADDEYDDGADDEADDSGAFDEAADEADDSAENNGAENNGADAVNDLGNDDHIGDDCIVHADTNHHDHTDAADAAADAATDTAAASDPAEASDRRGVPSEASLAPRGLILSEETPLQQLVGSPPPKTPPSSRAPVRPLAQRLALRWRRFEDLFETPPSAALLRAHVAAFSAWVGGNPERHRLYRSDRLYWSDQLLTEGGGAMVEGGAQHSAGGRELPDWGHCRYLHVVRKEKAEVYDLLRDVAEASLTNAPPSDTMEERLESLERHNSPKAVPARWLLLDDRGPPITAATSATTATAAAAAAAASATNAAPTATMSSRPPHSPTPQPNHRLELAAPSARSVPIWSVPTWNLLWTWRPARVARETLLPWQLANHFVESRQLTRKDLLKKHLQRLRLRHCKQVPPVCPQWAQ